MCGLIGFVQNVFFDENNAKNIIGMMSNKLQHRGPDSAGCWLDSINGIALGHRRLAILDLSPAGHQPMESNSERYVICFNGEIYNHNELRNELEKENSRELNVTWKGHSDTETLLACIESWGLESTLKRCVGMFSLALWDKQKNCLSLARDRFGEKPLYYGWNNGVFIFGSELKSFKAHPNFKPKIDRQSLTLLMRHSYVPSPYSIYEGISKLTAGSILELPLKALYNRQYATEPLKYWSVTNVISVGKNNQFTGTDEQAITELETLLSNSVKQQMIADVDIGAFLSGGIDSSLIVALMQMQSSQPIKTFTIGFDNNLFDESKYANKISKLLKTDHCELYITSNDAIDVIPKLSEIWDEPFADASQIPTFLVAKLARNNVKVALSGDGGDEIFGGYNRYMTAESIWRKIERLPDVGKSVLQKLLGSINTSQWDLYNAKFGHVLPKSLRFTHLGDKVQKINELLKVSGPESLYYGLTSVWQDPAMLVLNSTEPLSVLTDTNQWPTNTSFIEWMIALDTLTYMTDDILAKVDRASMAVSLETRVPILDHRVVEFSWCLPQHMKIRDNQGKWILRQLLYRHVPKEFFERPKQGFSVPLAEWLRGPLREWAEYLLDPLRLTQDGYFNVSYLRRIWGEHLSGKKNWQNQLWNVLMFQAWLIDENSTI